MPTLPHEHRRIAESFGTDAERYDRARPRYPDSLVQRILAASPGPEMLDVGCGTGIEARQFQAAGCRVLGVDPDERMADFARNTGIEAEVAKFEDWDPAGRTFDAVIAGQCWHWVDPVAGAAKVAEVLRPDGTFAAFGHVFGFPPEVAEAFAAVYKRVAPDSPVGIPLDPKQIVKGYQALYAKAGSEIHNSGGFGEPEPSRFDWEWTYTRDELLDLIPTQGNLTQLPPDKLTEVLDVVGAAVDAMGGSCTMAYTTVAIIVRRA
jgi:SAM-dependent methyltransferase